MESNPLKWVFLGLGAVGILVAGIVVGRMSNGGGETPGPEGRAAFHRPPLPPPPPPPPMAPGHAAPAGAPARLPPPPTAEPGAPEREVLSASLSGNLSGIVAAMRRAQEKNDFDNLTYCQLLLKSTLADDPTKVRDVLDLIRSETDMQRLDIYVSALAGDPASSASSEVAQAFLDLAEREGDVNRRQAALFYLGQIQPQDPQAMARLARLAQGDPSPQVQAGAVDTLATYMSKAPGQAGLIAQQLLQIGRAAADPVVRAKAVYAMQIQEAPTEAMRGVVTFLRDPERDVRVAAAQTLAGTRPELRGTVLPAIEQAHQTERDPIVRRNLVMSLVQVSPVDAGPMLQRMLSSAPPDQSADLRDFLQILSTGETNPQRILDEKMRIEAARAEGGR